jgi:hypothetical protein
MGLAPQAADLRATYLDFVLRVKLIRFTPESPCKETHTKFTTPHLVATMTLGELNHLGEDIGRRVLQNCDDQDFVPYCWLVDVLEEERIRKVLDETKIEVWRRPVFAAAIRADAMRIFGTLVLMKIPHLISDFITCEVTDGYLPMNIEGVQETLGKPRFERRLREIREEQQSERREKDGSYDEEIRDLEARIAPIDGWATTFVQKQFIFLSPDFSRSRAHRTIFDKRPLPFLRPRSSNADRREGHFGEVSEEKLPPPTFGVDGEEVLSDALVSTTIIEQQANVRCLAVFERDQEAVEVEGYKQIRGRRKMSEALECAISSKHSRALRFIHLRWRSQLPLSHRKPWRPSPPPRACSATSISDRL